MQIINLTRTKTPIKFLKYIEYIKLPKNYDLSVVLIGDHRSRTINRKYRNKDKIANVLSFPISKTTGEIFVNLNSAKRDHSKFNMDYETFVLFLLVHGVLHLRGFVHGEKMEKVEENFINSVVK